MYLTKRNSFISSDLYILSDMPKNFYEAEHFCLSGGANAPNAHPHPQNKLLPMDLPQSSGTYGVEKRQDRTAQMRVVKTASNGTRKVCSNCSYHNRDVALKLADTCI
ncbi:hypothetical protein LSAT2_010909 [Lamellibrachia satsuma]|nr:hypothetical protein LSAT2_010909 [Lamellibrachia satsuma]